MVVPALPGGTTAWPKKQANIQTAITFDWKLRLTRFNLRWIEDDKGFPNGPKNARQRDPVQQRMQRAIIGCAVGPARGQQSMRSSSNIYAAHARVTAACMQQRGNSSIVQRQLAANSACAAAEQRSYRQARAWERESGSGGPSMQQGI